MAHGPFSANRSTGGIRHSPGDTPAIRSGAQGTCIGERVYGALTKTCMSLGRVQHSKKGLHKSATVARFSPFIAEDVGARDMKYQLKGCIGVYAAFCFPSPKYFHAKLSNFQQNFICQQIRCHSSRRNQYKNESRSLHPNTGGILTPPSRTRGYSCQG